MSPRRLKISWYIIVHYTMNSNCNLSTVHFFHLIAASPNSHSGVVERTRDSISEDTLDFGEFVYRLMTEFKPSPSISLISHAGRELHSHIKMKALKCKTLRAELAHAYAYALHYNINITCVCAFYPDDRLPNLNARR